MKNAFKSQRLFPALTALSALSAAFVLSSTASASAIDPADPYQYTAGQYPSLQQNYGLPPQFSGQESMGMRQARFANGDQNATRVTAFNDGAVAMITTAPAPATAIQTNTVVSTNVAANTVSTSPVMTAIHASLAAIATTKGAVAVADSNDIAPSFSNAPYDSHTLLSVYQMRVDASSTQIDTLQGRSAQFAGDSQTRFNRAIQDVQASRAKLDQDFAAAQNATQDNWDQVRTQLANDYRAYSDAVARAQHAAS